MTPGDAIIIFGYAVIIIGYAVIIVGYDIPEGDGLDEGYKGTDWTNLTICVCSVCTCAAASSAFDTRVTLCVVVATYV